MSKIGPLQGVHGFSGGFSGFFKRAPRLSRRPAREGEAEFGFAVEDVAEIHLDKDGTDRHLWVQLKDGRIFDAPGFYGVQGAKDGSGISA